MKVLDRMLNSYQIWFLGFLSTLVYCQQQTCPQTRFRSSDGSCNNLRQPTIGQSGIPYTRFLPPAYGNGFSTPRFSVTGQELPNARDVSLLIARDVPNRFDIKDRTTLFSTWGLLLNLETSRRDDVKGAQGQKLDCCGADRGNPDCIPIKVSQRDPFYSRFRTSCLSVVRSISVMTDPQMATRQQVNFNEPFISGSIIYGSTEADSRSLRSFINGKLITSPSSTSPLLPVSGNQCGQVSCFLSGDPRVNLVPELVSLITILVRHHNRLADEFKQINPRWNDERLYQESRRVIGSLIQLVTYRDYLPLLLGAELMNKFGLTLVANSSEYFDGYDANVDPRTANVHAAAAFRFGHSDVAKSYDRLDANNKPLPGPTLSQTIMKPDEIYQSRLDPIIRGMIQQPMWSTDQFFTQEVTDHLFEQPGVPGTGLDLFAINVNRGRDHGLPGYLKWRRDFCQLNTPDDLNGIMPRDVADSLRDLYGNRMEDVDLYPAGVSEFLVKDGAVGPTFACIIGKQFQNFRKGDRFWFENRNFFSREQLEEIKNMNLADVLCIQTDTFDQVPTVVFTRTQQSSPGSSGKVDCKEKKRTFFLNPNVWRENSSGR